MESVALNPMSVNFTDHMESCRSPIAVSAQTISECASLLPPLSPLPPSAVKITDSQNPYNMTPVPQGSGSVTLLVPMNGPIAPKPGEKVFIDTTTQITSSDGIKLLIPVKGPSKHGETIFIKNAPNTGGGPVFLIPSQTDPNEKVLVPATSQQGGSSGAIILVPQPKTKSTKQSSQVTTRKNPRRTGATTTKEKSVVPSKKKSAVVQKKSSNTAATSKKKATGALQNGSTIIFPQEAPISSDELEKIVQQTLLKGGGTTIFVHQNKKTPTSNNGPGVTTRNVKRVSVNKSPNQMKPQKVTPTNNKSSGSIPITKTTCIPPSQRQPLILGDRARQMYEKNVNELKTVIKTQKRKIQKQQRDLDKLRLEKKEGVKHLPKKHLCKLIRKHLPGYVGQFIEAQLINYGVEVKNKNRWEMSDKVFALAMWHRSPLAYKLLRETFAMPSVKTLQHWTATVPPDLDFYDVLKELVKKKLPADEDEETKDGSPPEKPIGGGKLNSSTESVEKEVGDSDDSDTVVGSDAFDEDNS